jgi:hypothetical protein
MVEDSSKANDKAGEEQRIRNHTILVIECLDIYLQSSKYTPKSFRHDNYVQPNACSLLLGAERINNIRSIPKQWPEKHTIMHLAASVIQSATRRRGGG